MKIEEEIGNELGNRENASFRVFPMDFLFPNSFLISFSIFYFIS